MLFEKINQPLFIQPEFDSRIYMTEYAVQQQQQQIQIYFRNTAPYQNLLSLFHLHSWFTQREKSPKSSLYLSFSHASYGHCCGLSIISDTAFSARLFWISQALSSQEYQHNLFKLSPIRNWLLFLPGKAPLIHILHTCKFIYPAFLPR